MPIAGLSGVTSFDTVIAGGGHTFALDQQGRLWAWGLNHVGQLGLGNAISRNTPALVPIAGLSGVTSFDTIIVGGSYTLALDQQGRLWAWGLNESGQLGLGDTTNRNRPTLVSLTGLSGVSSFGALAVGWQHVLALDQQGRLWAWGLNESGQLGLGDTTNRNRPTLVSLTGLSGVSSFYAVIAGNTHTLAFDQQGRLWAWGNNAQGQLGLGDITDRNRPALVPIAGLSGVASFGAVVTGHSHVLAFDQAGRLRAWGLNSGGQLGLGDVIDRSSPTLISLAGLPGMRSFDTAIAGANHTLALDQQGRLWTWGANAQGQLGFGDNDNRNRPTRVTNLSTATIPLTKQLIAPESANLPDSMTFTFNLVPTTYEIGGTMSVVHSHTVNTQVTLDSDSDVDINNDMVITTESINLWQVINSIDFGTTTGVFVWNLEEQEGATGLPGMNYDTTRFQVRAWVDSDGGLVHVLVHNLTEVEGEDVAGTKVEPGPIFENAYFEGEGDLEISKVVEGDFANLNTPFNFTLTITEGPLGPIPLNLTGQIYNAANTPVSPPAGIVDISEGANTFTLRAGYRILIEDLPAGTAFVVHEAATTNFQPSAVVTTPGIGTPTFSSAGVSQSLTTASRNIAPNVVSTVVFTNHYNWVPPTGLAIAGISLIPFILTAFLLIALLTSRRRRAIETLPLA